MINYMLKIIAERNIYFKNIHTTLIGGASVILQNLITPTIGEQNIIKAKEILKQYDLRINRELIGGIKGYTIWYTFTDNIVKYKLHGTTEKRIL